MYVFVCVTLNGIGHLPQEVKLQNSVFKVLIYGTMFVHIKKKLKGIKENEKFCPHHTTRECDCIRQNPLYKVP